MRFKLLLLCFINLFRMPICSLMSLCKVKYYPFQLISTRTEIICTEKESRIEINNRIYTEKGSVLSARRGGKILFQGKAYLNRNVIIAAKSTIKIGNNVTIGPGTCIYDHDHDGNNGFISNPITIGDNVWIGAGSIILKGVEIGENSVIGAGSLVTKNVPSNCSFYNKRESVVKKLH